MTQWGQRLLTCNPDIHIIVSLSIVIFQVDTVDTRVRSLRGGNVELGVVCACGDDLSACGEDAILVPAHYWWRWSLWKSKIAVLKCWNLVWKEKGYILCRSSESYSEAEVKAKCFSSSHHHLVLQLPLEIESWCRWTGKQKVGIEIKSKERG